MAKVLELTTFLKVSTEFRITLKDKLSEKFKKAITQMFSKDYLDKFQSK